MMNRFEEYKDKVTGEYEKIAERYRKVFIKGDHSERIRKEKEKILKSYFIVIACFILVFSGYLAGKNDVLSSLVIEQNHVVSIERPEDDILELELDVGVLTDSGIKKKDVELRIRPSDDGDGVVEAEEAPSSEKTLDDLIREMATTVEDSPSKNMITLPDRLSDGTPVMWFKRRNCGWILIFLGFILTLIFIYSLRFDHVRKEEEKARLNIEMELPGFINKLVLLLNGGLVVSDAFERAVSGSRDSYFNKQLENIILNSKETNTPIQIQLLEFAKNSGVREFIRVAGIISDNIQKGSYLVEKLEIESSTLWFSRKKKAEELGKLAETRLTMPLMILLLVLITVTIAPALLEM